ncbi:cytochrome b/b6 domain-containing protein [Bacteroidota bacterium]
MSTTKFYLYPVWVRLWHIINALSFILLIITGISLHYADSKYGLISFKFSVTTHNICAIILTINYGLYVLGNVVSGNGKYYRGWKEDMFKNLIPQARFYISGIFKKEKHPFPINEKRKFNPLQKLSYVMVMYIGMPVLIISGLGLMFPETIIENIFGLSGFAMTDYLHQIIGFVLSVFLIIHIYTCTLGDKPSTLFKSIINGYHEEHD